MYYNVWSNGQELNLCSIRSWVRVLPYHDMKSLILEFFLKIITFFSILFWYFVFFLKQNWALISDEKTRAFITSRYIVSNWCLKNKTKSIKNYKKLKKIETKLKTIRKNYFKHELNTLYRIVMKIMVF